MLSTTQDGDIGRANLGSYDQPIEIHCFGQHGRDVDRVAGLRQHSCHRSIDGRMNREECALGFCVCELIARRLGLGIGFLVEPL